MSSRNLATALALVGFASLLRGEVTFAQSPLSGLDTMRLPNTALASLASTPLVLGLLRDLETTPYQAALGAVRFTNGETKQSVSIAPFRISNRRGLCDLRCPLTLGLSSSKQFSSLTIGWTYDNSTLDRGRLKQVLVGKVPVFDEARITTEDEATKAAARAKYFRMSVLPLVYSDAYDSLASGAWSIGVSATYQFFPTLKGTAIDADENGKVDEAYATRGLGILLTLSYAKSLSQSIQFGGGVAATRASAEFGKPLRRSPSAFVVARQRLKVLNPNYRSTDEWFQEMFVPAIFGTFGIEWQECRAVASECDSLTRRSVIITPAVEIRLSKATQFRIGLPIGTFRRGAKNSTELTPSFQFGLLLGTAP